jgi:hypothetical protein
METTRRHDGRGGPSDEHGVVGGDDETGSERLICRLRTALKINESHDQPVTQAEPL